MICDVSLYLNIPYQAVAQTYYKMDIEIEVVSGPSHYNERMNGAPQDWLNWLNYQGGSDQHPTAWFTATKDDWQLWSPRINGYSNIGAICVRPGLG